MIECLRCGECCRSMGDIRLSVNEYRMLTKIISFDAEYKKGKYLMKMPCVFLKDNICSIHRTIRPTMCRMYHCGRIKEGDKRVEWLRYEMRILIDSNPEYKKFITEMQDKAAKYGDTHGWRFHKKGQK